MAVNLTLRRNKGAALTHNELDDNFTELANAGIDSAAIIGMIDSAYVQARQFGLDSSLVEQMIDSDYINSRVDDFTQTIYHFIDSNSGQQIFVGADKYNKTLAVNPKSATVYINGVLQTPDDYIFNSVGTLLQLATPTDSDDIVTIVGIDGGVLGIDSAELYRLIDSDYIQARDRFRDSSFITGIVDSSYVKSFIDSDHVTGLIDSHVTNLIDSDYISNRVPADLVTGSGIAGGVNTTPLTHPVGSYMIAKSLRSVTQTYNTGATYPGIFPGDTISGGNLYYQSGITGSGYPDGTYNTISIGAGTWKALAYVSDTTVEGSIRIGGINYDASTSVLYQRVA